MIKIRRSEERGHLNHGWLDTYHTFSFSEYYDPEFMNFRDLRVINQDWIDKGVGFGTHPHNNMEIITYVLEGELAHKDSMGNGSVIYPGDIQYMSAGTGVTHSEFNNSKTTPVRLFQIWILPDKRNVEPSYNQKNFTEAQKLNNLKLIVSNDGRNDSIGINQNINIYASVVEKDKEINYEIPDNRHVWIQVAEGDLILNGEHKLNSGDGVAISDIKELNIKANNKSEFLIFDLK
jgi:redox-sensitive bicupin YhaK (pirin superfamily)